ncbi:MAG: hypothetical protein ACYC6V_05735 [Bacillota bacterium]
MPEGDWRERLDRGLTWTIQAGRRVWARAIKEPGGRTGGLVVGALAFLVIVAALFLAFRPTGPFFKRGTPPPGVVVSPATPTGSTLAAAAAAVPGARPVIVLVAGNTAFVGLDPGQARRGIEPRVASAVRRAAGPWPSDEARINDPAAPAIARVYVTAEAKAVDGLTAAGRRLLAGEPLATVVADLVPVFLSVGGVAPAAAPGP